MNSIKDLIQETEKERTDSMRKDENPTQSIMRKLLADERYKTLTEVSTLVQKQCQTIADEREKEIFEIIENKLFEDDEEKYYGIKLNYDTWETIKQQLNPAQTKDENN
jgi:hypothetical protein